MSSNPRWTELAIETLKRLQSQSLSATAISEALYSTTGIAFSRNSVIGKLHRLGLSGRSCLPKKRGSDATRALRERTEANKRGVFAAAVAPPGFASTAPPAPDPDAPKRWICEALPESKPCPLLDLTTDQCRWPLGQVDGTQLFCGAPYAVKKPGFYSYCRTHWEWRVGISSPRKQNADEKDAA